MMNEFKKFIAQGNVLDLAVGVVIGGAFGKIVNSLVADILMPLLGLILRGINVTQQFIALDGNSYATLEEAKAKGAAALTYGNFLQASIDFLAIA
jgi:large conductance mechanosensitive channel